ncbi:DMT family transporter [Clostridium thermarum]|uniref:DMT family transporter n=1 Tax=Clostridium thermarum TaxID=1716543 RepID=UPI0013D5BB9E|nr:DMT family transporter [Clostridium thermarum]
MSGLIFAIVAGVAMSLQGVFNTRLGAKIGCWQTNLTVQGTAFLITLLVVLFVRDGSLKNIKEVNKLYLLGGVLGVVIIFTVMKGIEFLGPTYAISTILVAQLTAAAIIDALGLFESTKVQFGTTKIIGVLVMIVGIIIFKWKG